MGLKEELEESVADIFREQWTSRDGQVVPEDDDLKLSNEAVKLDAVVLYADMSASTQLVDGHKPHFAAEVYKSYLYCAARVIRNEGGTITAYDGDRIMAVFVGDLKNTTAAKTALKLNYVRIKVINPAIKAQYPESTYELKHVVGIDASNLFVARTGIRGTNDLVWVGPAANYAAKLCTLSSDYPTRITKKVYDKLTNEAKCTKDGTNMWQSANWTDTGEIYRSTYMWDI